MIWIARIFNQLFSYLKHLYYPLAGTSCLSAHLLFFLLDVQKLIRHAGLFQVLFLELKLPQNGDVKVQENKKTLGYVRRATAKGNRVRLSKQFSTTKVQ